MSETIYKVSFSEVEPYMEVEGNGMTEEEMLHEIIFGGLDD